jgi:energy-coupling factor transport system permease protein
LIDPTRIFKAFQISKERTPYSSLHPMTKFLIFLSFLVIPLLRDDIISQLSIFLLQVPIMICSKTGKRIGESLKGSSLFLIMIIVLNYIFIRDLLYSIAMGLRLTNLLVASAILMVATNPMEIGDILSMIRVPYYITFSFVIALRFVPVLARDVENIVVAQRSRGMKIATGGLLKRARSLIPLLIPMIIISIRRSQQLSEALEVRAFGSGKRSFYYSYRWSYSDIIFILYTIICWIVIVRGYPFP